MFKKLKLLISAAAFVAVGVVGQANAELSDILSAGTIKIAIPENFPPFGSLGAEGEYEGYDVDVAKLIAEDLGAYELFNLQTDPYEQNELSKKHPEKFKELMKIMKDHLAEADKVNWKRPSQLVKKKK